MDRRAKRIKGDLLDEGVFEASLRGVTHLVHLAASVGVGQSMSNIVDYTRNNVMTAAVILETLSRRAHTVERSRRVIDVDLRRRRVPSALNRKSGGTAVAQPRTARGASLGAIDGWRRSDSHRDGRGETATALLDLRHQQTRSRGNVSRGGPHASNSDRSSALVQCVRLPSSAQQSVYRRCGDIYLSASQRSAAASLRRRAAEAGFRARRRRRQRVS